MAQFLKRDIVNFEQNFEEMKAKWSEMRKREQWKMGAWSMPEAFKVKTISKNGYHHYIFLRLSTQFSHDTHVETLKVWILKTRLRAIAELVMVFPI